jgi:hypothetical protein
VWHGGKLNHCSAPRWALKITIAMACRPRGWAGNAAASHGLRAREAAGRHGRHTVGIVSGADVRSEGAWSHDMRAAGDDNSGCACQGKLRVWRASLAPIGHVNPLHHPEFRLHDADASWMLVNNERMRRYLASGIRLAPSCWPRK